MSEPVILGVLQNQWAHDPQQLQASLARLAEHRHQFIKRMLARSLSGRRLRDFLGDWFDVITWENASPIVTNTARGAPVGDAKHLQAVVDEVKPIVTIAFGRHAQRCVCQVREAGKVFNVIHPAARNRLAVVTELCELRTNLDGLENPDV